jgi:hypothetical protein
MADNVRALPMWFKLSIATALYVLAIVPLVAIPIKYGIVRPFSTLPIDYWIWLTFMVMVWLIVTFVFRLFSREGGVPVPRISFLSYASSQGVWTFSIIVFAAISLAGFFGGDTLILAPAIVISDLGLVGTAQPLLSRLK